jgi:hypothetical protein
MHFVIRVLIVNVCSYLGDDDQPQTSASSTASASSTSQRVIAAAYTPYDSSDYHIFFLGLQLFHFLPAVGRTKQGSLSFLSWKMEDERDRSINSPGCAFSPCLKLVQEIYLINQMKISRADAQKKMIEQYNIVYQEYNFDLH